MNEALNSTSEDTFAVSPTRECVEQLLAWVKVIRDVRTSINTARCKDDGESELTHLENFQAEFFCENHDLHIATALEFLAKMLDGDRSFALVNNEPELARIRTELRTQDNCCTADPVFVVQQQLRVFGFDSDYAEGFVWLDEESDEVPKEEAELLTKDGDVPNGWHYIGYRETYQYVMPFFTRQEAQAYIDQNRHNLRNPRVYVESAYRNYEWQRVVALLLSKP